MNEAIRSQFDKATEAAFNAKSVKLILRHQDTPPNLTHDSTFEHVVEVSATSIYSKVLQAAGWSEEKLQRYFGPKIDDMEQLIGYAVVCRYTESKDDEGGIERNVEPLWDETRTRPGQPVLRFESVEHLEAYLIPEGVDESDEIEVARAKAAKAAKKAKKADKTETPTDTTPTDSSGTDTPSS